MLYVVLAVVPKVLLFGLGLLLLLWCWFQVTHWRILRFASSIPSPFTALPILGHAHYLLLGREGAARVFLDEMGKLRNEKGHDMCSFWIGPIPIICVFKPEDIKKVLNSSCTTDKPAEYETFRYHMGDGLLTAQWKLWKVTRRHINPLFHARNLQHMIPVFNRNSRELVAVLSERVDAAPLNVFPHVLDTSLKTVCQLIFGPQLEFDTKTEEFQGLKWVVLKIFELAALRLVLLWLRVDLILKLFYGKKMIKMKILWKRFTKTPLKLAQDKRTEEITDILNYYNSSEEDVTEPLTLVDIYGFLQRNFPHITKKDMKAEMITLYTTGSDTVATAMSSCLIALAHYQHIQEKVYQEMMSVVGQDDDVTAQDILRMPYLDQVFKETLRWATIIPFIGRKTTEDLKLSSHTIPAGSTIAIMIERLNQDPTMYANPTEFDPERFSPQSAQERGIYAYIPFSAGPRNCIGKRYAELLMKTMLIHVLRKYRLSTLIDIHHAKKKFCSTVVLADGYNISFECRDSNNNNNV